MSYVDGWADWVRLLNITLVCLYLGLFVLTLPRFLRIPRAGIQRGWSVLAYSLATLWASWETLASNQTAPGVRSYLCWRSWRRSRCSTTSPSLPPDALERTTTMVETRPVTIRQPNGATFRGCDCLAQWWPLLNQIAKRRGIIRQQVDVTQGAYNRSVSASAATHAGGGVLDLAQYGQALDDLLELAGAASYVRTAADGFSPHIHMILIGCPHLDPSAAAQVTSWRNGRNALRGNLRDRDTTRPSPIRSWREGLAWMRAELDPIIPAIPKPAPIPAPVPKEDDMAHIESISDAAADKLGAAIAKHLIGQSQSQHLVVHSAVESLSDRAAGKLTAALAAKVAQS